MLKVQRLGVEHQPIRLTVAFIVAVEIASKDRVTNGLTVNSQLVRAPGGRPEGHCAARRRIQPLVNAIIRARRFAEFCTDFQTRENRIVLRNGELDQPFVVFQVTAQYRLIGLDHRALLQLPGQMSVDDPVECNHHDPGSSEIQPMHQRRPGEIPNQTCMNRIVV